MQDVIKLFVGLDAIRSAPLAWWPRSVIQFCITLLVPAAL